jgi:hypothetical protein
VPIARKLHAVRQTRGNIVHKDASGFGVAASDQARDYQFRVGVDRGPRPYVTSLFGRFLGGRHAALLAVVERPYFIDLDTLTWQPMQVPLLIIGASPAGGHQKSRNGVDDDACRAGHSTEAQRLSERFAFVHPG